MASLGVRQAGSRRHAKVVLKERKQFFLPGQDQLCANLQKRGHDFSRDHRVVGLSLHTPQNERPAWLPLQGRQDTGARDHRLAYMGFLCAHLPSEAPQ